jgi:phosphoribosylamine--glycine ligase
MHVLVVGGGAREHAMAWTLARERSAGRVLCAPGNAGIAAIATCVSADVSDPASLLSLVEREHVDLTIIGPELPLSQGVADALAHARRLVVGPTRAAAALESSKAFAKAFMGRHRVPTANFVLCSTPEHALEVLGRGELGYPVVVKADGLAAGKGVVIADDHAAAVAAIRDAMVQRRFGDAGARVVLEEFLVGEEASYFVLADGTRMMPFGSAQDHKRIFDGDRGPNTGGMGAFSPSPLVTAEMEQRILAEIVQPVLHGMVHEGTPFQGFLYVGLMLTAEGPKVVEFNVRFGDPEAQVVFPRLDEDFSALMLAAATGSLPSRPARLREEAAVGVVLAADGYPGEYRQGAVIEGLEQAQHMPHATIFHAGTAAREGHIVTAGGRVLTVVGRGATHRDAIDTAYAASACIHFAGMQYRRDVGAKALARS